MRSQRHRVMGLGAIALLVGGLSACGGANVGPVNAGAASCERDARRNLAFDVMTTDVGVATRLRARYGAVAPRVRVLLLGQTSLEEAETRVTRSLAFYRDLNLTAAAEMIAEALRLFHARVTEGAQRPKWIRALWVAAEIELARGQPDAARGHLSHAYNLDPASQPNADEFSPSVRTSYDEMLAARLAGEGVVEIELLPDAFVYVDGTQWRAGSHRLAAGSHFAKVEVLGCEPVLREFRIEAAEAVVRLPGDYTHECRLTRDHAVPMEHAHVPSVDGQASAGPSVPAVNPVLDLENTTYVPGRYVVTLAGQGFDVSRRNEAAVVGAGVSLEVAVDTFERLDSAPMRQCFAARNGDDTALHWGIAIATTAALVGGGIAIGVALDNARPYQRPILTDQ